MLNNLPSLWSNFLSGSSAWASVLQLLSIGAVGLSICMPLARLCKGRAAGLGGVNTRLQRHRSFEALPAARSLDRPDGGTPSSYVRAFYLRLDRVCRSWAPQSRQRSRIP